MNLESFGISGVGGLTGGGLISYLLARIKMGGIKEKLAVCEQKLVTSEKQVASLKDGVQFKDTCEATHEGLNQRLTSIDDRLGQVVDHLMGGKKK